MSEGDKRAYIIHLTPKALDIQEDILAIVDEWNDTISKGIDCQEFSKALETLRKMSSNALEIRK